MKDPAFLFYPNDYIGGTMGMTFEEKGAYIELLMMQFNRGHMTEHMIIHTVGQLWDTLKVKFIQDENSLWYNERLELEKNSRKKYTESRRNNVLGLNQFNKPEKKEGHMTKHMEDVNEIVDVSKGKIKNPSLEDVKKFFEENGYSLIIAEKAYVFYNEANWHDSNGKKVRNWKQKMRVVWFKEENKKIANKYDWDKNDPKNQF